MYLLMALIVFVFVRKEIMGAENSRRPGKIISLIFDLIT
jgi:hypothetical protein